MTANDPFFQEKKAKLQEIEEILSLPNGQLNIRRLRQLAVTKFGLINKETRIKAWPHLLGIDPDAATDLNVETVVQSPEWDQVQKDVDRSLFRFTEEAEVRMEQRKHLSRLINRVLVNNPSLHYFQGFHDVASVFLLVFGEQKAVAMLERVSLNHIRDALAATLENTSFILNAAFPLLERLDVRLSHFIKESEVQPYFALSWILTWFAYNFDDFDVVCRFYDLFLATHPLMPLYVTVAIVLHRKEEILKTPCEFSAVHGLLSKLPPDLPFEVIIAKAVELETAFPADTFLKHLGEDLSKTTAGTVNFPYPWLSDGSNEPLFAKPTNWWAIAGGVVVVAVGVALLRDRITHLPL